MINEALFTYNQLLLGAWDVALRTTKDLLICIILFLYRRSKDMSGKNKYFRRFVLCLFSFGS